MVLEKLEVFTNNQIPLPISNYTEKFMWITDMKTKAEMIILLG